MMCKLVTVGLRCKVMPLCICLLVAAGASIAEQHKGYGYPDLKEAHIGTLIRVAYRDKVARTAGAQYDCEVYQLHMVLWEIYGGRTAGMPVICDGSPTQSLLRSLPRSQVLYEEFAKLDEVEKALFLRDASDYLGCPATDWLSTRSLAPRQQLYAALYRLYSEDKWESFTVAMDKAQIAGRWEDSISVVGCVPRKYMQKAETYLRGRGLEGAGSEVADWIYCLFRVRERNAVGFRGQ